MGVGNYLFWSEIGSGFEEQGDKPNQEFPGVVLQSLVDCTFKLQFTYMAYYVSAI